MLRIGLVCSRLQENQEGGECNHCHTGLTPGVKPVLSGYTIKGPFRWPLNLAAQHLLATAYKTAINL